MSGISTSVEVVDRVSGSLNRITAALYSTTNAFNAVDRASDVAFNSEGVHAMTQEMYGYEQRIRQLESDLVDANRRLEEMEEQTKKAAQAGDMLKKAFNAVKGIMSGMAVKSILQTSDELVSTTARLNNMNDGLQTTDELVHMVYQSAQNARGSFADMADVVARFGNNVGIGENSVFGSSEEVVAFAELLQKQMTIAGAGTSEASAAMLQLSQGLGSGVLRGDELNSIFEQAPNLIQNIATYIEENEEVAKHMAKIAGVSYEEMSTNAMGHIRDLAQEGQLSADLVKTAIFSASDDINKKFDDMPKTWGQIWQSMQNTALIKFQPILEKINEIADSESFQTFTNIVFNSMTYIANAVLTIFDTLGAVAQFAADNWSWLGPIIGAVIAVILLWKTATLIMTAVQTIMNSALWACPVTWIIVLIIALIAIIVMVCNWLAKTTEIANTGFGVICGGINVVIQFFKNLGLAVANIALGIWNAINASCDNMVAVFWNTICSVQAFFWGLLETVMDVIAGIAKALNKLPFIEFDYSGIVDKADEFAAKKAEAEGNKMEYQNVGDAFADGFDTFDTFKDGWVSDAFESGAEWGDGAMDKLGDLTSSLEIPSIDDAYTNTGSGSMLDTLNGVESNTSDAVDISNENIKYLRDIAEKEAVNRFTTAEIKVDMTNNNNIASNTDLDGIITSLSDGLLEAMATTAEGVHV